MNYACCNFNSMNPQKPDVALNLRLASMSLSDFVEPFDMEPEIRQLTFLESKVGCYNKHLSSKTVFSKK